MKIILFLAALILIVGFSSLTYSKFGIFNFTGGSHSTLHLVRSSSKVIAALSVILLTYLAFLLYYSKSGVAEIVILLFFIALWIVSGRAIGILPDGRIVTGWFLFATNTVDFRDHNEDPEIYIANTQILVRPGWLLEIQSDSQRTKVFVGPLISVSLLKILVESGYNVVIEN